MLNGIVVLAAYYYDSQGVEGYEVRLKLILILLLILILEFLE